MRYYVIFICFLFLSCMKSVQYQVLTLRQFNLYSEPDFKSKIITVIPSDALLQIEKGIRIKVKEKSLTEAVWKKTEFENHTGYIYYQPYLLYVQDEELKLNHKLYRQLQDFNEHFGGEYTHGEDGFGLWWPSESKYKMIRVVNLNLKNSDFDLVTISDSKALLRNEFYEMEIALLPEKVITVKVLKDSTGGLSSLKGKKWYAKYFYIDRCELRDACSIYINKDVEFQTLLGKKSIKEICKDDVIIMQSGGKTIYRLVMDIFYSDVEKDIFFLTTFAIDKKPPEELKPKCVEN